MTSAPFRVSGNGFTSTVFGIVARADISRIAGTHWNLNGYWRGRMQSSQAPAQSSIQDLINRTYQMSLNYVNPESHWTAGIGRLYLPWASSLEVIDGGYVARSYVTQQHPGSFHGIDSRSDGLELQSKAQTIRRIHEFAWRRMG